MRDQTGQLLEEIARCPVVVSCRSGHEHPCRRVVDTQQDVRLSRHQVPEPWSGRLDEALILFVGTSPAIARGEDYPVWSDPPADVAAYFEHRFGDGPRQVRDGIYPPIPGRHSRTPLQSWVALKARAAELVDDPVPGLDYAVTYAVHCRAEGELGVRRALTVCPDRYLPRVVAAARRVLVLVAVGPLARSAVHEALGLADNADVRHLGPVPVEGRDRHVVFLDHFGGYGDVKEVAAAVDPATLREIQRALAAERARPAAADGSPAEDTTDEDAAALLRGALGAAAAGFEAGEACWLATGGRLADAVLARAGWLLQRAAPALAVRVIASPPGIVASAGGRSVLCSPYAVVPAGECLRPGGSDRAFGWARDQVLAAGSGPVTAAVLAVPVPGADTGPPDPGALDRAAEALAAVGDPRLRVERFRVTDGGPAGPMPYLDLYLVEPRP